MDNYFAQTDTDAIRLVSRLIYKNPNVYSEIHLTEDFHCRFVCILRNYVSKHIVAKVYFRHFVDCELDSFFSNNASGEYEHVLPFK